MSKIFLICLLLITLKLPIYTSQGIKHVFLQKELVQHPCSMQDQPIILGSQFFSSTATTKEIGVSGWIQPRGYSTNYSLLTVYQNINLVIAANYDAKLQTLLVKVGTSLFEASSPCILIQYQWYFLRSYVQTISGISGWIRISDLSFSYQGIQGPLSWVYSQFQLADLLFFIGNISSSYPMNPFCLYSEYVILTIDTTISSTFTFNQLFLNQAGRDSTLLWYFDAFYTQANSNKLLSISGEIQSIIPLTMADPSSMNSGDFFETDFFPIEGSDGFLVTFDMKLTFATSACDVMCLVTKNSQMPIQATATGFNFNGLTKSATVFNTWIHVAFLFSQGFGSVFSLLVRGYGIGNIQTSVGYNIFLISLMFGSSTNTCQFNLENIRIYRGAYFTQEATCDMNIGRDSKECIFCSAGYNLDYSSGANCNGEASKPLALDDVLLQTYKNSNCPENMFYDLSGNGICTCRDQYYKTGNICVQCPRHCNGCTSASSCIKQDPNRDSNGSCPSPMFDDGYLCLTSLYYLPVQKNYVAQLPAFDLSCLHPSVFSNVLSTTNLNVSEGDSSIFFSYSFLATEITPLSILAYVSNKGTEIITLTYTNQPISGFVTNNAAISLYVSLSYIDKIIIHPNEPFWIAVWTDLKSVQLIVKSHGQFLYRSTSGSFASQVFGSFRVCVGQCMSLLSGGSLSYTCGQFQVAPFQFVKGIKILSSKSLPEMSYLLAISTPLSGWFYYGSTTYSSSNLSVKNALGVSIQLIFTALPLATDRFKGFQLSESTYIYYPGTFSSSFLLNFKCTLYFETLHKQVSVFYYEYSTESVEYYIFPNENFQAAFVRVCYRLTCKDTKYAMLPYKQPNHLFIYTRETSMFMTAVSDQEFIVLCNYMRETIIFSRNYASSFGLKSNIRILKQTFRTSYSIYVNHIHMESSDNFFYFQYDLSDRCFLRRERSSMTCFYLKAGYYFYGDTFISEADCKALNMKGTSQYYIPNPYSQECEGTGIAYNGCDQLIWVNSAYQCVCYDTNADASNKCECYDGFYYDPVTSSCQVCDSICATCSGTSSTCVLCSHDNQSPPTCNCSLSNHFKDSANVCQACSQKCGSCEGTSSNCTECAADRINSPPTCPCYEGYSENTSTQLCEIITCSSQCYTCATSASNCMICSGNTIDPPTCQCDSNSFQDSNGNCQSCEDSYYLDSHTNTCKQCSAICSTCSGSSTNCTGCEAGFQLSSSTCLCSEGSMCYNPSTSTVSCAQNMDASLVVQLTDGSYYLLVTFDYELATIDFSTFPLSSALTLYFSGIDSSYFQLSDPIISGNQLLVKLVINKSFSNLKGRLTFPQYFLFHTASEDYSLDSSYSTNPLVFSIGPYIFTESQLSSSLSQLLSAEKSMNSSVSSLLVNFQVLFYLLNTLQPTAQFFLLKAQFPPNLYVFYQVIGTLVYPHFPDYGTCSYPTTYSSFGYSFSQNEIFSANQEKMKMLGFSNSSIVNIPIVSLKYLIDTLIMVSAYLFLKLSIQSSPKTRQRLTKLQKSMFNTLDSENEANCLFLVLTSCIQFSSMDQEYWSSRWGLYITVFLITIVAIQLHRNLKIVFFGNETQQESCELFSSRLRFSIRSLFYRSYFFFQLLKKITITLVLYFLYNFPLLSCLICGTLTALSSILTICTEPYKQERTRRVKILGDLLLSVTWFLHIPIVLIEKNFSGETVLTDSQLQNYFLFGNIIMIVLSLFNLAFLIEFVWQQIPMITKIFNKQFVKSQTIDIVEVDEDNLKDNKVKQ